MLEQGLSLTCDVLLALVLWDALFLVFLPAERMRVPPGPFCGGRDARGVLCDGAALVCGCDRPVHHPRE